MLAVLKKYNGVENYENKKVEVVIELDKTEKPLTVFSATNLGRKLASKDRKEGNLVCYVVETRRGEVIHKLPTF